MSRMIKLTDEYLAECRAAFEEELKKLRLCDGKLSFTKYFGDTKQKAEVFFTPLAWTKMSLLINEFGEEIAWHGSTRRMDPGEDGRPRYLIDDIVVYPQRVSAASVDMDELEYAKWLIENGGDERFTRLGFQGHSHVRMGVTPSAVDLQHQSDILQMVRPDGFYIFMIVNKNFDINCKVYDLAANTLYENGDVEIKLLDGGESLDKFLADAKAKVKERPALQAKPDAKEPAGKKGKGSKPRAKAYDYPSDYGAGYGYGGVYGYGYD